AAERPVGLVAEIKHATYFDSVGLPLDRLIAEELRRAGWHDDPRLTVESFELDVLHGIREHGVTAPLVSLIEASGAPADRVARDGQRARPYADDLTPEGLAALREAGIAGISVDKRLLLRADAAGNTLGITSI